MDQLALPDVGFGTWENTDPEECISSVQTALEAGYRHVDTAQYYGNEEYVGRGIERASVDREDVIVATKLHPETCGLGYEDVLAGAEASLDRLGVEYIDLLYVHWPVLDYDPAETLKAFDELRDRGVITEIGLSNFSIELLEEAEAVLESPLFAHQIEMHPLFRQEELCRYARERGHFLVAYSPLARGDVLDIELLQELAHQYDASPAQISLAWLLSKENVVTIPKSTDPEHIRANLEGVELELDPEDVARIDGIEREHRYVERPGAPWLGAE